MREPLAEMPFPETEGFSCGREMREQGGSNPSWTERGHGSSTFPGLESLPIIRLNGVICRVRNAFYGLKGINNITRCCATCLVLRKPKKRRVKNFSFLFQFPSHNTERGSRLSQTLLQNGQQSTGRGDKKEEEMLSTMTNIPCSCPETGKTSTATNSWPPQ